MNNLRKLKNSFHDDHFDNFFDDSMKNFDRELSHIKPRRLFRFGLGLWFVGLLAAGAFWGTVIYIAIHFVGKFW